MPRLTIALFLLFLLSAGAISSLRAQGGPPMLTDDPGTPAAGHTEFNLAITLERRPHVQAWMLPELDYNYGFTDRFQVNFLTSYNVGTSATTDRSAVSAACRAR